MKILHINNRLDCSREPQTYHIQLIRELAIINVENVVIYEKKQKILTALKKEDE